MVLCCVPKCGTDSWKCDPSITFHDFPSSPDLAAKWIQQINCAVKCNPMWFPRGISVLCSKHFLSTDFKDDSDSLKPRVVPTVFGFKYIGQSPDVEEIPTVNITNSYASPLIVKIKTEDEGNKKRIPSLNSKIQQLEKIAIRPETTPILQNTNVVHTTNTLKTYSKVQPLEEINKPVTTTVLQNTNIVHTNKTPRTNSEIQPLEEIINEPELTPVLDNTNAIQPNNNLTTFSNMGVKQNRNISAQNNAALNKESLNNKLPSVSNKSNQKNKTKKPVQKRENNDNLIEIGPNTFLKINPDIIKINKKLTPSGNTVLQFLMDQTLANTIGADVLPKIVQGAISNISAVTDNLMKETSDMLPNVAMAPMENPEASKTDTVVQHVVGHLVDTHVCKESCAKLQEIDNILMETDVQEPESVSSSLANNVQSDKDIADPSPSLSEQPVKSGSLAVSNEGVTEESTKSQNSEMPTSNANADTSCIAKAPVLLTTNMSLAHCFMEKTKYLSNLRQKARQIATLKQKVSSLNKKIEELEDKCIVQERQLSFSFLKRLRTIHKNASKGDPSATYILEQVRAYTGQKQMRWSSSTLHQCAIWCRKAPYAYEYFKKADFFKLPCLGTVKRYMRKHPEMSFTNKSSTNAGDDDDASSSDFDFDESMEEQDKEGNSEAIMCETVMSEEASNSGHAQELPSEDTAAMKNTEEESDKMVCESAVPVENSNDANAVPVTVDTTNLEVQELILPSGEVVQCYSSNICNGSEAGNQYYIIPNEGDQNSNINHEYSIIQSAESVPVILQNIDSSQLQQEQLIFITNSTEQVECTETEVVTAQ